MTKGFPKLLTESLSSREDGRPNARRAAARPSYQNHKFD